MIKGWKQSQNNSKLNWVQAWVKAWVWDWVQAWEQNICKKVECLRNIDLNTNVASNFWTTKIC